MYSVSQKFKPVLDLIKPFLRLKATTATTSVQFNEALPNIPGPSFFKLALNHLPRGKEQLINCNIK